MGMNTRRRKGLSNSNGRRICSTMFGKEIGVSDVHRRSGESSTKFADATGDPSMDPCRCRARQREMPGGKTIALWLSDMSLVPRLGQTIYRVKHRSRGLNYGSNRVRFYGTVQAGSRISVAPEDYQVCRAGRGWRAHHLGKHGRGRGNSRPALVAETISMQFDLTRERAMRWQRFWSSRESGCGPGNRCGTRR